MWSPKRHVFISLLFILKCFSKPFVIRSFNSRKENFVCDRLRSPLPPFDICCIQETMNMISDPVLYRSFASVGGAAVIGLRRLVGGRFSCSCF